MKRIIASFVLLLCTACTLQAQTKRFVTPGAPTTGTGNAWADPLDLQTAITAAAAGDSVFVAQGTYQRASGQKFIMKEGVKIYGGFAGTEMSLAERNISAGHISTLLGNNARVVENVNNGLTAAAILDGFTITNGNDSYGGGMLNQSASPTISNCIFTTNRGGGMYNAFSSATIIKCVFRGNYIADISSTFSGGIANASSRFVSIINCIFSGNTGAWAGAVYMDDLGPTSPAIINCTIINNTATRPNGAGAIFCQSQAAPKIQNCIIWGNSSGIRLASTVHVPVITNNIIQGGYPFNWNLDPLFADASNPAGADNIFGTADDGLRLQAGSPACNTGTANITGLQLPDTDMAGSIRIQGNRVDVGAYESDITCPAFTTLHVDSSIAISGNGSSWATAFKTFEEALIGANQCPNVGNIWVAKGTYQAAPGSSFSMVQQVKIYGGFPNGGGSFAQRNTAIYTTILKGSNAQVIYNVDLNATALLDGFTITGGSGGMYNLRASPAINNCVFLGNVASAAGGAMYNENGADPAISNCIFSGNTVTMTGGGGGGAIYNYSSSPVISHCIFHNNTGAWGGAIYNHGSATSPIITNTVFVGNVTVGGDGAGIANYGGSLKLTNVTFANNNAGGGGGAIDTWNSSLTITNTLFWGNTSTNNFTDIWWTGGSGSVNHSFTQTSWAGTGNILGSSSPFLNVAVPAGADGIWNTADDGITLRAGSLCNNAGTPDTTGLGVGDTDITGSPRIVNAAIDIGAYEYQVILPITLISFTGSLHNGVANLQWRSGEETNFNHFEVEKSTDGSLFRALATIAAKGSNSHYNYSTLQQEPTAHYRLKLVDNDGSATNSRIVTLSQTTGKSLLVYPNPATNTVYMKVPDAGSMDLYAADGKLVKTQLMQAGLNKVDISKLQAGVYYGVINGIQVRLIKK